jgi:uncharacterized protein YcfL
MKKGFSIITLLSVALILLIGCSTNPSSKNDSSAYQIVEVEKTQALNADLKAGIPTIDMAIYYPNIQDTAFARLMPMDALLADFQYAKDIYAEVGVQLNLLWVKKFDIEPELLTIMADKPIGAPPPDEDMNMYRQMQITKASLTERTQNIFDTIIEPHSENNRTVYLIGMKKVTMQFYEKDSLGVWEIVAGKTSGLSFPGYILEDRIPERMRGVITINKVKPKIIAHELGHKVLNVSHEHKEIDPAHAIYHEEGLMLYGKGTEILSGKEGRWHKERLLLSPFIYIMDEDGNKVWNPDYKEAGHYFDPIYGGYVIK